LLVGSKTQTAPFPCFGLRTSRRLKP
jgi:hypothetical protein